jgi:hypothetical protein
VEALAARMNPNDRVLLTGRDPNASAPPRLPCPSTGAAIEGRVLDVRDGDAIDALAAELGEVDIVFSNATARMSPDADPADGSTQCADEQSRDLAHVARLRPPSHGRRAPPHRASALGTPRQARRAHTSAFAAAAANLDVVDALVGEWRDDRPRRPRGRGGLRDLAEHPVEGRAGRRGPRGRA